MDCTSCGHHNHGTARFCAGCGGSLAGECPACDEARRAGARFCSQCGSAVDARGTDATRRLVAQRKTITVVFGDVGGSMGLGERLDPEAAREVMHRYHTDVLEVIGAHGGAVDKFNGDGFMATFGIPEVAEDDARRAVEAAIGIQERFAPFAAEVQERFAGDPITLRIGVNTGEIVIAEGDLDIIGDALNVAARLERACPAGRVLVGPETWRLTRHAWSFEPQGEVTVAGRVEPVEVFLVRDAEGIEAESVAPFVGREPELDVLQRALDEAIEGRTLRLVTVVGSPGLGKTRLAREAAARLAVDQVHTVACERAGSSTFAPILDLVRAVAGVSAAAAPEAVLDAIGGLFAAADLSADDVERITGALTGLAGAGPARTSDEVFWAVRRIVELLGRRGSTLLVVDDVQWAEPVVLDLLEHLTDWVGDAVVVVLCLARPEIRDMRPSITEPGRRAHHVVALEGLDATATAQLASRMLGSGELPAALVERLPASTEGNPLFVRELVKMLVDDGVVQHSGDGWELTIDVDAVEVPPTIQSLLAARIDRLDDVGRRVLERASVIGPDFPEGALRAVVGDVPGGLPRALERLRRMELVEATGSYWDGQPMHRFHHVLVRDAAYRRILKGSRADLHEQVAAWIEGSRRDPIGDDEAVAFHEEQAYRYRRELGPLDERGVELGRRAAARLGGAADRALARDDLSAATSLALRAVDCVPSTDTRDRAELLLVACEAALGAGDVGVGERLVDDLDAVATDDRLRAWASCFRAQLTSMTDPDRLHVAELEATAAAGILQALGDDAGAAKGHHIRARILVLLGRIGEAESELDLALTAARAADDSRRITAVLGSAPLAAVWGPSPVQIAGGRCLDIVRLLRTTTRAPAVEAISMRCQAWLEALRGRFDASRSMIDECRRKVADVGLQLGALETELFAGQIEFLAGDFDAAESALRKAHAGLAAMRLGAEAGQAAALLARVLLAKDEIAEAEKLAAEAEQLAGRNLKAAVAWRLARVDVLVAVDQPSEAVDVARAAIELVADTDLVVDRADAELALGRALAAVGDHEGCETAASRARTLATAKGASALIDVGIDDVAPQLVHPIEAADEGDRRQASFDVRDPFDTKFARLGRRLQELEPTDPAFFDCFGAGFELVDRRLGLGNREDRPDVVERIPAELESGVTTIHLPITILGDRAAMERARYVQDGSDRESFVNETINVLAMDRDERLERMTTYDHDQLDDALVELWDHYRRHCDEDGLDPIDNLAVRADVGVCAAMSVLGVGAAGERWHRPDVRVDHARIADPPIDLSSPEGLRAAFDVGWMVFPRPIDVAGDRSSLAHSTWVGPSDPGVDPVRYEVLHVCRVDDAGRVVESLLFPIDQLAEARSELTRASSAP